MKQRNTGNGIKDNGDGMATVKVGKGTVRVRYEGDHEAVKIVPRGPEKVRYEVNHDLAT